MPITSEQVLLKMNEIQGQGRRPVADWHELRRWLLEDSQVQEDFFEALINDKEMSREDKEHWLQNGADLIKAERIRQINQEGWTAEHDDEHMACELSMAASAYLRHAVGQINGVHFAEEEPDIPAEWPWDDEWWKPSDDPKRNLVKAGALIAAQIDLQKRIENQKGIKGDI